MSFDRERLLRETLAILRDRLPLLIRIDDPEAYIRTVTVDHLKPRDELWAKVHPANDMLIGIGGSIVLARDTGNHRSPWRIIERSTWRDWRTADNGWGCLADAVQRILSIQFLDSGKLGIAEPSPWPEPDAAGLAFCLRHHIDDRRFLESIGAGRDGTPFFDRVASKVEKVGDEAMRIVFPGGMSFLVTVTREEKPAS